MSTNEAFFSFAHLIISLAIRFEALRPGEKSPMNIAMFCFGSA